MHVCTLKKQQTLTICVFYSEYSEKSPVKSYLEKILNKCACVCKSTTTEHDLKSFAFYILTLINKTIALDLDDFL